MYINATSISEEELIKYFNWTMLSKNDMLVFDKLLIIFNNDINNAINDVKGNYLIKPEEQEYMLNRVANNLAKLYNNIIFALYTEHFSINDLNGLVSSNTTLDNIWENISNTVDTNDINKSYRKKYLRDYIILLSSTNYKDINNILKQLEIVILSMLDSDKEYLKSILDITGDLTPNDLLKMFRTVDNNGLVHHAYIESDINRYSDELNKHDGKFEDTLLKLKRLTIN